MAQYRARTVIVTGASSGIGLALARSLLERGDNVVGNSRTIERLEAAADVLGRPDKFLPVAGDVAQPQTAKGLFAEAINRFGQVDVLVNNAGIFVAKAFADYSTEDLDALISTNLKGFFYMTQEAVRHMTARKQGHIVPPGIIDTPLYTSDMHGFLSTLQPAGRIGRPQEIVDAILYLSEATFTTGVVLPVDGGMSTGKW